MPSIISTGIGSGLDITGIVQQLVAAEGRPVEFRLGQQEARVQAKLSAYGTLKSALSEFRDSLDTLRDLDTFLARTASTTETSPYTVSATGSAVPSTYSVEVVTLATAQKLTSGVFTDSTAVVGTGTLQIKIGTDTFGVVVDSTNNTLAGIRDSINSAITNTGVTASIVNADAGSYLILTGDSTGLANTMTVTQSGGDGGLSTLEYDPANSLLSLTETIAPVDSLIRIDGFDVMTGSNSVTTAIQGVTINLTKADVGVPATLTVANDEITAKASVNKFVDSYNDLVDVIAGLARYDADSQVSGPLFGDSTLRNIQSQIRREMSKVVTDIDADFTTLSEIGVGLELDGKLKTDDTQLSTILSEDFAKLGHLFSNSDGYAVRLYSVVDSYLSTDGALDSRLDGLNKQIEGIDDDRVSLNARLIAVETRLLRQFNAMDALLGELTLTSNFLSEQLANLPGYTLPNTRR